MIGHPIEQQPTFDATLAQIGQAVERLQQRPFGDFSDWIAGERIRRTPYGVVAQATEVTLAATVLVAVTQLVPEQREQAALMLLRHIGDHVRVGLGLRPEGAPAAAKEAPRD